MEVVFYILAPAITLLYKLLDYNKWIDNITGRSYRLSGLRRLKTFTGYPKGWIFNDSEDLNEFQALIKIIKSNTTSDKLKMVFKEGHNPSLITTGGDPFKINGIDENWDVHERMFYSNQHPVIVVFGVNRQGGNGHGEKACTLAELEKWIEDEKRKREFWVGTVAISLLSIGLILRRFIQAG